MQSDPTGTEGGRRTWRSVRLRVWSLMALVAMTAAGTWGIRLLDRSASSRREAARHAEREKYWTWRRDQFRGTLSGLIERGQAPPFLFGSVRYEDPGRWEVAMEQIIAYHEGSRRAYERAAGRPWESVAPPAPPEALSMHVEVEAEIARAMRTERGADPERSR
jgi:hypothetical protein